MNKRAAILILLLGAFVLGAVMLARLRMLPSRTLPARELSTRGTVAAAPEVAQPEPAAAEPSVDDLFAQTDLPATEKAHLLEIALQSEDEHLMAKAESLLTTMMQTGTVADVLAAIPKLQYFTSAFANVQESLCRFREDEFGFEVIKSKFNKFLGNEPSLKPWDTVCGAG